jgi:hypothetical protein
LDELRFQACFVEESEFAVPTGRGDATAEKTIGRATSTWLSTHPPTFNRIARAYEAAREFDATHPKAEAPNDDA